MGTLVAYDFILSLFFFVFFFSVSVFELSQLVHYDPVQ